MLSDNAQPPQVEQLPTMRRPSSKHVRVGPVTNATAPPLPSSHPERSRPSMRYRTSKGAPAKHPSGALAFPVLVHPAPNKLKHRSSPHHPQSMDQIQTRSLPLPVTMPQHHHQASQWPSLFRPDDFQKQYLEHTAYLKWVQAQREREEQQRTRQRREHRKHRKRALEESMKKTSAQLNLLNQVRQVLSSLQLSSA